MNIYIAIWFFSTIFLLYILKKNRDSCRIARDRLHHQNKNSIQMILGLLDMQVFRIDNVECKDTLISHINRIRSIGIVYESLYKEVGGMVSIEPIFREVIYNLQKSTSNSIDFDIDDIELDIKSINSTLLILNEALFNAIKYAYGDSSGVIEVNFTKIGNVYTLLIVDEGVGFDIDSVKKSLGLVLMESLAKSLSKGGIYISSSNRGTEVKVEFIREER